MVYYFLSARPRKLNIFGNKEQKNTNLQNVLPHKTCFIFTFLTNPKCLIIFFKGPVILSDPEDEDD